MSAELKRFFDSISFSGDGFSDATLDKVVLKKKEEKFIVYIKNKDVIDVGNVNQLFWCASNGINNELACVVNLVYENVTFEDIKNYLDYFIDEIIIRRPSMIGIKSSEIEINGDTLYFEVLNDFERGGLLHEAPSIINNLKRYGLGEYKLDILIREDLRETLREEIKHDKDTVIKEEDSPVIMGKHMDGAVTQLNNILGEVRNIIVEVYVFGKEVVERQGKKVQYLL